MHGTEAAEEADELFDEPEEVGYTLFRSSIYRHYRLPLSALDACVSHRWMAASLMIAA